ncbi:MAG TPA: galactitol-1-phosphate 5-dehydrogenase [Anaerolineales bacterium]|nr:galactitol-1-phosphate 5-dehydrogenase [Anaerolineales bacterium]
MKALVLKEYTQFAYEDVPMPQLGPQDVLVQVKACGICGSDVHGMDGSTGRRIPPLIMGHEASGVITKVGEEVTGWMEGDRVTFDSTVYPLDDWYTRQGLYNLSDNRQVLGVSCEDYRRHGAFAEYVSVPQHILYRVPDSVSFKQAAMVEPVAVSLHALSLTPLRLRDTALVVGSGMIGLFMVQVLRAAGCSQIIAIDLEDRKLELAQRLGATTVLNPQRDDIPVSVRGLTAGRGADVAFEAVGITAAIQTAIESVRKGGTVTLIGNISRSIELPLQMVVTRQIRLQGTCSICGEYPAALNMIEKGIINVDNLISATAPLADGAEWFHRLYTQGNDLMKVILNPT